MCYLLKFSKPILVPLCTEWISLEDFVMLDSSASYVYRALLDLPIQYESQCLRLFDSNRVLPLVLQYVLWFKKHFFLPISMHTLTSNSGDLLRIVFPNSPSLFSSLRLWRRKAETEIIKSSVKLFLLNVRRLTVDVSLLDSIDIEASVLRDAFANVNELLLLNTAALNMYVALSLPFDSLLDVRLSESPEPGVLCAMLRKLVGIQRFTIDQPTVDLSMITTLVVHCRHLTYLQIHLKGTSQSSIRRAYFAVAYHCGQLFTSLQCQLVNQTLLKALLVHRCSHDLRSVSFTQLNVSTPGLLDCLAERTSTHLTSLSLTYVSSVSTAILNKIKSSFSNLQTLQLVDCFDFEESAVRLLLCEYPVCTELELTRNHAINDGTFTSLMSESRADNKIKHLSLMHCNQLTDPSLISIPQLCRVLTSLNLSGLNRISDEGILPLLMTGRLQRLNISYTSLSERSVVHIAQYCFDLRELRMNQLAHSVDSLMGVVQCCRVLTSVHCDVSRHSSTYLGVLISADSVESLVKSVNPKLDLKITVVQNRYLSTIRK